jgi:hypothetical protein
MSCLQHVTRTCFPIPKFVQRDLRQNTFRDELSEFRSKSLCQSLPFITLFI